MHPSGVATSHPVTASVSFFSSRRRHTRWKRDWSSDVCYSDLRCDRPAGHQSRAGHLLQHRGLLGAAGDTHRLDAGRAASAAPVQEGDGMMLWDEVTVRSRLTGDQRPDDMTVPAHVYTVSGTNPAYPHRPGMMGHSLRASIGPDTPRAVR